jgi:hypothetical protein
VYSRYTVYKYSLRWMVITMAAGYTFSDWIFQGLVHIRPKETPALVPVGIKLFAMLAFARWFRTLLRKDLPVEVAEMRIPNDR